MHNRLEEKSFYAIESIPIKRTYINNTIFILNFLAMLAAAFFLSWLADIFLWNPYYVTFAIGMTLLVLFGHKDLRVDLLALLYLALLLILIYYDIAKFPIMPQAEALLQSNTSFVFWIQHINEHPHAIRLLISYPAYILATLFNIDLIMGSSLYMSIVFMLLYLTLSKNINFYRNSYLLSQPIKYIVLLLLLLILAAIMNGRLAFSFLGFSIIIYTYAKIIRQEILNKWTMILYFLFGFLLTTVSSGTMFVAGACLVAMVLKLHGKKFDQTTIFFALVLSPIMCQIVAYGISMLKKNIAYYGGGWSGAFYMLKHGVGAFIINNYVVLLLGLILIFVLIRIILRYFFQAADVETALNMGIAISIAGALFGYSTGFMLLIPLIIKVISKV